MQEIVGNRSIDLHCHILVQLITILGAAKNIRHYGYIPRGKKSFEQWN